MSIEEAIDKAFPDAHPHYKKMIYWRYDCVYLVPEEEAVKAILKGYSSPSAAMASHVIKRRPSNPKADELGYLYFR